MALYRGKIAILAALTLVSVPAPAFAASGTGSIMPTLGSTAPLNQPAQIAAGTDQSFAHDTTTTAPPDAVWQLWTDVRRWKEWDRGLKDASLSGPMALGSKGSIVPLSGPSSSFKVTAFDAGKSYTFVTTLPLATLTVRRTIIQTAPTVFRHEVSFSGALGRTFAKRLGPGFRTALPPTMAAIAALAEQAER